MNPEVEIDGGQVIARIEVIPQRMRAALESRFVTIGLALTAQMKEEVGGLSLGVRTGTGRRSIGYRVDSGDTEIATFVGPDLGKAPYMRMQNFGGVIRPRSAANLTIPIGDALTGNGVARFTAKELIANPQAYGYKSTFFHNGVLFGVQAGAKGYGNGTFTRSGKAVATSQAINYVPLFVLKASVTIPAHYFMENTLAVKETFIRDQISQGIAEGLNG